MKIKVEYLFFLGPNGGELSITSKNGFINILNADEKLKINGNKLEFEKIITKFNVTVEKTDAKIYYVHLTFECDNDNSVENFDKLLKVIRTKLFAFSKKVQTLYDGLSLYYANQAYPIIFEVENLMRKLITKFMLIKVGDNWDKDNTPDDVKITVKDENINYLHNIDFIKLKDFLFSEKFNSDKDILIKKLRKIDETTINELKVEDLKSLIPTSNWEKFFSDLISNSDKDKIVSQWDSLYELRCKVAHNKIFNEDDLNKVKQLSDELKTIIENAIFVIDSVTVSDEEKSELIIEKESVEESNIENGNPFSLVRNIDVCCKGINNVDTIKEIIDTIKKINGVESAYSKQFFTGSGHFHIDVSIKYDQLNINSKRIIKRKISDIVGAFRYSVYHTTR
jgi:Apea-like HEPN